MTDHMEPTLGETIANELGHHEHLGGPLDHRVAAWLAERIDLAHYPAVTSAVARMFGYVEEAWGVDGEEEDGFEIIGDDLEFIEPDEYLDGDWDTGMASAGFGTDEDYGYYGDGCED